MTAAFPALLPGAEPYFQRGSERAGVLLLHGFSAAPAEVRWLGEHLAEEGFTAYAPRLPGHGADYRDISRMRWRDWVLAAMDGYHLLAQQCEKVVIAGHSMGGLITLLIAAEAKQTAAQTAGVCVMAAPVFFSRRTDLFTRFAKPALRYSDQTDRSAFVGKLKEEQARRGEPAVGRVRYNRWSTGGVHQVIELAKAADAHLHQIQLPLLLIYAQNDQTAPPANGEHIARVATFSTELRILDKGGHILTQDQGKTQVFDWVSGFAHTVTGL